MGLDSYIMTVGQYSTAVAEYLEYSVGYYLHTKEGTTVFGTDLCQCVTSDQSRALAEALGIEVWDFNSHRLQPLHLLSEPVKQKLILVNAGWAEDLDIANELAKADFLFIFRPEG